MERTLASRPQYWLERIREDEPLSLNDAMEILSDVNFHDRLRMADTLASEQVGDTVTYAISYNINYSNYCAASCPICAFYVPAKLKGRTDRGYELNESDVRAEARKAKELGATEVHVVGGFNPYLEMEYYETIFKAIKQEAPNATLKALTIPEIDFIAKTTGNSLKEVILRLKASGVDAHTGGGAEIFDEEVRKKITTKEKISGERWLEDAKEIHRLGLPGNSTITYGHLENYRQIVDHFTRLRDCQVEVPGIISIIPLKFSLENTPLERAGLVKREASAEKDLNVISLARIIAGKAIKNISVYWVALGKLVAQVALRSGGSDLVGTAYREKIFGATNKFTQTSTEELSSMILKMGKIPAERDTFYNIVRYS